MDIRGAVIPTSATLGIGLVSSGHRAPQLPDRVVDSQPLTAIGSGALPAVDHSGGLRVQPLFPTALGMAQIGRLITKDEMDYFYSLEMGRNSGNLVSVERRVLDSAAMTDIRAFIEQNIETYLREIMCGSPEVRLVITQSWVNVTQPGQFHHHHKHPNSVVSGVFYPQATAERDRIHFSREVGPETIRIDPTEFNTFNSSIWWIPVRTGTLVLFPSGLHHKVEEVTAGDERISLSFNTFPVGNVGNRNDLTGLYVGSVSDHSSTE